MNKELEKITSSACRHIDAIAEATKKINEIEGRDATCNLCPTRIYPGIDGSLNGLCFDCLDELYNDRDCDEPEEEE